MCDITNCQDCKHRRGELCTVWPCGSQSGYHRTDTVQGIIFNGEGCETFQPKKMYLTRIIRSIKKLVR